MRFHTVILLAVYIAPVWPTDPSIIIQAPAPWNLARLTSKIPVDFHKKLAYRHFKNGGEGVDVYVLDTGVLINHDEFEGRAQSGKTFLGNLPTDAPQYDADGHGTSCASIVAGRTAGVAKKARIISVKVAKRIDSYHPSDWVKAMMYVLRQHQEDTGRLSIALLSLEGPQHASIDHAAVLLAQEGIHVVVAAGNRAAGTPLRSSAHLAGVTVVGAVNMYDEREVPLQWVPEVADIHAPGKSILAASASPKTTFRYMKGSSAAAAHTAGVIACILSRDRGQKLWTPEKMKIELTRLALHNVVRGIPYGWPNFLLHFDPEGAVAREAPGTWGGAYGSREIMRIGA